MQFNYPLLRAVFCLLLLLATDPILQATPKGKAPGEITYHIRSLAPDSAALQVSFTYRTDAQGALSLMYENNSWGDKNLFDCIACLEVSPASAQVVFLRGKDQIRIEAAPNQEVQVQYTLTQDFKGPLKNSHRYRPIIQKEYFHLLGMRLFITPENLFKSETDSARIDIQWATPAAGSIFHSSFGPETHQQVYLTRDMLHSTFFAGGDFRRYTYSYKGQQVHLITRGQWKPFQEQDILGILKTTIPAQMAFWKDKLQAPYSVSLLPTFEQWTDSSKAYSQGGSCLTNSFISFASNNPGTTLQRMRWLYNHELFHRWIGTTIANEQEEKQYWFSEGFTDYYAYKLQLRAKQLTVAEYLEILNKEVLAPHYRSSVKGIPNEAITQEKYWSETRYNKLPYRRGLLYALLLDTQIKQKYKGKKSLDHLMQDVLADAKRTPAYKFNHKDFQKHLERYLGLEALAAFDTYIVQGTPIDFSLALPSGLLLQTEKEIPALFIAPTADSKKLQTMLAK